MESHPKHEHLFQEAKKGDFRAWCEFVDLAQCDLFWWLTRHFRPKLRRSELEEICELALCGMGEKLLAIPSWPQAWVYSQKVAVSHLKDRLCRGQRPLSPYPREVADPLSNRSHEKTEFLDQLECAAAGLTPRQCNVLFKLCSAVLEGKTSSCVAKELRMSLRSFERAKREVIALCKEWFSSRAKGGAR